MIFPVGQFILGLVIGLATICDAVGVDFAALDEAVPKGGNTIKYAPVFDFDTDGCLPSAGISRLGAQNPGLSRETGPTEGCRSDTFLDTSNTLHRYACIASGGSNYCGHFYTLYFLKDYSKIFGVEGGHRNDWEYAAIWTKDGIVTHGSASAHGNLPTRPIEVLPFQGDNLKIVYHSDESWGGTHALRFAKPGEVAENPYHRFVTPPIASWYELKGDGLSNEEMRNRLNEFCYNCCEHCGGSIPVRDKDFLNNLNKFRPVYCDEIGLCLPGAYVYPEFTQESIDASNPNNAVLKLIEGDGSFTGEESEYFLDFGQIPVGRHRLIAKLAVVNEVYEPADRLDVDFDTTATAPYLCTGCDNFTDLPWSGEGRWSFVVEIPTAGYGPGVVTSQIVLQPKGLVDTGEREPLEPITLTMSLEMVPSDNDGEIVPTDGGGGGSGDSPLGCSMSPNRNRAGFDATLMFISIIATVYIGMRRKNIHY